MNVTVTDSQREFLTRLDFNSLFSEAIDGNCDDDLIIPTPFELNNIESHYWDTEQLSSHFSHDALKNLFLHLNI